MKVSVIVSIVSVVALFATMSTSVKAGEFLLTKGCFGACQQTLENLPGCRLTILRSADKENLLINTTCSKEDLEKITQTNPDCGTCKIIHKG